MGVKPFEVFKIVSGKRERRIRIWLISSRVRAWVHRFNANCWRPADQRLKGELTPLELSHAEEAIVREVQTKTFEAEREALRKKTSRSQDNVHWHH